MQALLYSSFVSLTDQQMSSDIFRFKQFVVRQSDSAMKVGTDGVLLGAWSTASEKRILDVGTGTGLIALMLAQRTEANIIGVEIDRQAACEAKSNFEQSPWSSRLHVVCADVRQYHFGPPFDLIVCNPPFYAHSQASSSLARDRARSGETLSLSQLIQFASHHLNTQGRLEVILPAQIAEQFRLDCWTQGLFLMRQTQVITCPGKSPKRSLMSFGLVEMTVQRDTLCLLDSEGRRTAQYQALTTDFYL